MFKNKIKFEGKTVKNVRQSFFILCIFLGTLQKLNKSLFSLFFDLEKYKRKAIEFK